MFQGYLGCFFFARRALVYNLLFYKCIYIERAMAELLVILTSIMLKQPEMLKNNTMNKTRRKFLMYFYFNFGALNNDC